MSVSGLERLDYLAQRYSRRPSEWLDRRDTAAWTDTDRFLFDETCALAGVRAETRAAQAAREQFDKEWAERDGRPTSGLGIVDRHGRPIKNTGSGGRQRSPAQSNEPIELKGPDGEKVMLRKTIPFAPRKPREPSPPEGRVVIPEGLRTK